ncbi:transglutaminase domain-containing protein [Mycetocola tolaasinivorans]|uniref:Transglutaminase domain-containing protein n=1 Tax=Mycetocola tolaasinivorans TaxID=76635 RepID=A0A3L7A6X1_9MICO|nr:transglutaminase domain-containing protein [Mycetocola tolaasinivorans]RLP76083.1 transglutaminase domain-containing protein [Mycetocola tolaasinivorans]
MSRQSRDFSRSSRTPAASEHRTHGAEGILLTLLVLAAATPLWSLYADPAILRLVGVSAAVALGLGMLARVGRWPGAVVIAVSAIVLIVLAVPLGVPSRAEFGVVPTVDGLREAAWAAVAGWKQIVTVEPPLGTYRGVLVPALIVVFGCAMAAHWLLDRTRSRGWSLLPVVVILGFGIAMGPSDPPLTVASGIALAGCGLLWGTLLTLGVFARARGDAPTRGGFAARSSRGMSALLVVGIAASAGLAAGIAVEPRLDREVARTRVVAPFDPRQFVSPLVAYRNSVTSPANAQTQLEIEGVPAGTRVRLATLDDYDGQVFSSGAGASETESAAGAGSYRQVPVRMSDPEPGDPVSVRITVRELSGVWLPIVGSPRSVAFADIDRAEHFYYNGPANAAALAEGITPGLTYSLETVLPEDLDDGALAGLRPGTALQSDAPVSPALLEQAAEGFAPTWLTPGERLLEITRWLRSGYISHSGEGEPFTRPGHSAGRLNVLAESAPLMGDAEQYSTALAVLARGIGFPSRVVLGYVANSERILGDDLTAWTEVQDASGRWIGIDPVPLVREIPPDEETPVEAQPQPETVLPPPPAIIEDPLDSRATDDEGTPEEEEPAEWLATLLAIWHGGWPVLLAAVILFLPLWGLALVRGVRRRRRRRRDRARRTLVGGWNEVRDALIDRGTDVPVSATRFETVRAWSSADPRATPETAVRVSVLAERANAAEFARDQVSTAEVSAYWAELRQELRALSAGEGPWARFRRFLTARSIRDSIADRWAGTRPATNHEMRGNNHGSSASRHSGQRRAF